jgi:hypothetical protein
LHPKPALLFFIAKKVSKKASPLGTYKTYFEPGVLQLPTVKQIKRLYNSVQNRFYKQVQKGALNGKRLNGTQQQQRQQLKTQNKKNHLKINVSQKKFCVENILKIWGLCLPLFHRGCFVFFF